MQSIQTGNTNFIPFPSRRSVVHSTNGIVACTQPLAARAGQRILEAGGNAADAAVAVAAALNMTEPCSTGIGGDMFCLFYDAATKKVHALNGSGRYPADVTLEGVRKDLGLKLNEVSVIPFDSVHAVTVPGAAAGWVDTIEQFGSKKLSLSDILQPAIELGEEGFPVSEIASISWARGEGLLKDASPNFGEMLKTDPNANDQKRAPGAGEIMYNPTLANTFKLLGEKGKKGFYEGPVAEALVNVVQDLGGHLTLDDLKYHEKMGSEIGDAISIKFNEQQDRKDGVQIWEHPPNGQGIVALMVLGIIEQLQRTGKVRKFGEKDHNSAEYLHVLIEALRIAFADAQWWVTDPDVEKVPVEKMLSQAYLAERAKIFDQNKVADVIYHGSPAYNHCDTVYFAVTDKYGNGISFINSNYAGFGTGIIPKGCGFTLQDRASNFSLERGHPNVLAPRKRPYHTIIPALVTNSGDASLYCVFGVMGGFMQPQGHVQVLLNMLIFKHSPQTALDAPRFCIVAGAPGEAQRDRRVYLEEGISEEVAAQLTALGHEVEIIKGHSRGIFGRGQVIRCRVDDGRPVFSAGSDPRGDGAAYPI